MIDEYMLVISMESMELIFRKDERTPDAWRYVPYKCPMMYGFYAIHAERIDTLAAIKLAH